MKAATGKFGQVSLTGQPGQGCLGRAAWAEQPGRSRKDKVSRDRSAWTGQTGLSGQPGQVSLIGQCRQVSRDRF